MTVICGYCDGDVVIMGSDSSSSDEEHNIHIRRPDSKLWKVDLGNVKMLVGFAGNFAECQFIKHHFKWPLLYNSTSVEKWLVTKVQPALNDQLSKRFKREVSWSLLVGLNKPARLFTLNDCGDVEYHISKYASLGSGFTYALGALAAMESENLTIWEKVEQSIRIAETYRADVRGPINIIDL